MALVFKIKHKETLRRWVVSQTLPDSSSEFSLTVHELGLKIRELFHISAQDVIVVTYVDKEGDVVTLANDQDLIDACFVQSLNPLRLEVKTLESGQKSSAESVASNTRSPALLDGDKNADSVSAPLPNRNDNANSDDTSRHAFPQATADAIKQFIAKYTQNIDPNLQPAVLIKNIRKALKEFVKTIVHEGQRLAPRGVVPSSASPAGATCPARSPSCSSPKGDGEDQLVHFGVRCDGCKLYPIGGLRYKSSKVFNYDLCSGCFNKMGIESEYQRIEKPVQLPCHGFHRLPLADGKTNGVPTKWMSPFASGSDGWKSECPFLHTPSGHPVDIYKKYDASFCKDVSVFDGEELSPCTNFTRTLCLKNTGSLPWSQGTQLVFIGGDKLALESAVVLKLPEGGLSMGLEFDVSVDMRAPDKAGNYISHWCLMAPDGERFGQSVWVAIHVDGEVNAIYQAQFTSARDEMAQTIEEVNKLESNIVCAQASKADDACPFTENKGLGGYKADGGRSDVKQAATSPQFIVSALKEFDNVGSGTDEVDGFSMIEKPGEGGSFKMMQTPLVSSQLAYPQPVGVIDEQYGRMSPLEIANQEMNLHELHLMGFKNRDLNAILLEKNNQDLQLTLDDLLLGSGWDNLLKDLQEMGFDDANTNLRLLIKNEGSIKQVVKELVELEKLKAED